MGTSPIALYHNRLHSLYALHLCVSLLFPLYCNYGREALFGIMPFADFVLRFEFCIERLLIQNFLKWLKARIPRGCGSLHGKSFRNHAFSSHITDTDLAQYFDARPHNFGYI